MTLEIQSRTGVRPLAPRVNAFTKFFWAELEQGRLQTTRCGACGRLSFPPSAYCRGCGDRSFQWIDLSGLGRIYSTTIIHAAPRLFAKEAPYQVAIVDLEEGVRLVARAAGESPLEIDTDCRLMVLQFEDGPLLAATSA